MDESRSLDPDLRKHLGVGRCPWRLKRTRAGETFAGSRAERRRGPIRRNQSEGQQMVQRRIALADPHIGVQIIDCLVAVHQHQQATLHRCQGTAALRNLLPTPVGFGQSGSRLHAALP